MMFTVFGYLVRILTVSKAQSTSEIKVGRTDFSLVTWS